MLTRYNGNLVPFANGADPSKRYVFGGTTASDNINDNINSDFLTGWEIVGQNDAPPKQWFNALGYTSTYLAAYLYQMGIPEWNINQEYFINSRAMGSDGDIYKSLSGTSGTPNVGNDPVGDIVNWEKDTFVLDIPSYTEKTTPVDNDLFVFSDSEDSNNNKKISFSNLKANITTELPSIIGTATLDGATQTINLNGIGSIGLNIGDVISVVGNTYNKFHTVEQIIDNNNIIVNYEHRGTSTPIPDGRLDNITETITVKLEAKAALAPIGLGQFWCYPASGRNKNTNYTNTTQRTIQIYTWGDMGGNTLHLNNLTSTQEDYQGASWISLDITKDLSYRIDGVANIATWLELR